MACKGCQDRRAQIVALAKRTAAVAAKFKPRVKK